MLQQLHPVCYQAPCHQRASCHPACYQALCHQQASCHPACCHVPCRLQASFHHRGCNRQCAPQLEPELQIVCRGSLNWHRVEPHHSSVQKEPAALSRTYLDFQVPVALGSA